MSAAESSPDSAGAAREDSATEAEATRPGMSQRIPWRAIIIGALLLPVNALWIHTSELLWGGAWPDAASLLFNAVFALFLLALANIALRRWLPRWALTPAELVIVYVMVSLGTTICGHDFTQVLVILLTTASYYGTPENNWHEMFADELPSSLLVTDPQAVVSFWEGEASLYTMEALRPWLVPLATWGVFVVALLAVMMALDALVLRRWNDEEKLSYPLLEVPMQLTRPGLELVGPSLLNNRLLWIGFAIAGGIDLLNGFANLYPSIPELHVTMINLTPALKSYPWRAMGWTVVAIYPFAIGLGYMMPKDFLFSCFFFYWFWKMELVLGHIMGRQYAGFPYASEQAYGAYVGIGIFALWTGRRYFANALRGLLPGEQADSEGGVAYGVIVAIVGVALLVVVLFTTSVMGVTPASALLFLGGYLLLVFSITRMRAEFGLPVHDFWTGPLALSVSIAGARPFGSRNLVAMSPLWWLVRSQRSQPMPHGLEGMTLGRRRGLNLRTMLTVVGVTVLVGTLASFWSMVHVGYTYGMGLDPASDAIYLAKPAFSRTASWVEMPPPAHWDRLAGMIGGFVFTVSLLLLRLRFLWWPLHPAGYAASSMRFMGLLWLPMLVAWIIKTTVMRYGGYKLYQRLYPFFLGLILGEFVIGGGLWGLAGTIGRFPTYRFWPY